LIDGETGGHLWAKNYDGVLDDVFDMQDRITAQVAGTIHPMIEDAEIERSRAKRTDRLDAYDLLLQAVAKQYTEHMSSSAQTYELLARAIELDPNYAPALSEASFMLASRAAFGWPALTADDRARAVELARRALKTANGDARTQAQVAVILMHADHAYGEALQLARNAMERNPNYLIAMTYCSVVEMHCGDVRRAIELSTRFMALSPADAGRHLAMAAIAHSNMILGEFAEAVGWAERSLSVNDEYQATYWFLVAGNAMLDRMDEARRWLARLLGLNPGLTIALLRAGQPAFSPDRIANILEGLRRAGLREA
jgi:tetratricopeptide (TPR) repeat protein